MESVIKALKDTPIPTIMVVAGIVFLLLSIAGQLAGRITVPPERQRQATIIGCLLVMVGVALHVVPPRLIPPEPQGVPAPTPPQPTSKEDQPPQTSTAPPKIEPPASTPGSTPPPPKVEEIPSLNARLTALRFFESNPCEVPPLEERTYRQRFAQVITREIFTELTLEHPKHERRRGITIQGFYRHKGREVGRPELETDISADRQGSVYWFYKGQNEVARPLCFNYPRGQWSAGSYTVDVYINGDKVTSGSFEIYE
jgi:hypothetical protein